MTNHFSDEGKLGLISSIILYFTYSFFTFRLLSKHVDVNMLPHVPLDRFLKCLHAMEGFIVLKLSNYANFKEASGK